MNDGPRHSDIVLALRGVERVYKSGTAELRVLSGVDLMIRPGELVAMIGPSGAGKSTLLHIAGLLERPDAGTVVLDGADCTRLPDAQRTRLRREHLGFVYQFHHLLPEFSALENVALPQRLCGRSSGVASERASQLLSALGLSERRSHRPAELSGGEQQRVAIARAIANDPSLLLADEPTGNLDPGTAAGVFEAFTRLARENGLAALIATHNHDLARQLDRAISLEAGRLREI